MINNDEVTDDDNHCANCGIAGSDNIKLKKCGACQSVRYCGIKCQKEHRPKHKRACKELHAAKLRDERLFQQPESTHLGDCPICFLPIPPDDPDKYSLNDCCGKVICSGCGYASAVAEAEQGNLPTCPFCRTQVCRSREVIKKNREKRAAANDPEAIVRIGIDCYDEGNFAAAFGHFSRAAKLGDAFAHYRLSLMYSEGKGVEKNEKMKTFHQEEAAVGGHVIARYNLGLSEGRKCNADRAFKHWIISANLGHANSMQRLKEFHRLGLVKKDDLAAALRAHHAALEAMKSPQREKVEAVLKQANK